MALAGLRLKLLTRSSTARRPAGPPRPVMLAYTSASRLTGEAARRRREAGHVLRRVTRTSSRFVSRCAATAVATLERRPSRVARVRARSASAGAAPVSVARVTRKFIGHVTVVVVVVVMVTVVAVIVVMVVVVVDVVVVDVVVVAVVVVAVVVVDVVVVVVIVVDVAVVDVAVVVVVVTVLVVAVVVVVV